MVRDHEYLIVCRRSPRYFECRLEGPYFQGSLGKDTIRQDFAGRTYIQADLWAYNFLHLGVDYCSAGSDFSEPAGHSKYRVCQRDLKVRCRC